MEKKNVFLGFVLMGLLVVLATGNGLKDSVAAARGICVPETLVTTVDDIL